ANETRERLEKILARRRRELGIADPDDGVLPRLITGHFGIARADVKQDVQDTHDSQEESGEKPNFNESAEADENARRSHSAERTPQERAKDRLMADLNAGRELSLSTWEHVLAAYQIHLEESPASPWGRADDGWQSDLWAFTRMMKAHPALKDQSAEHALREIERVIAQWPFIPTEEFTQDVAKSRSISVKATVRWWCWFHVWPEDARVEFLSNWDAVRCIPGHTPLDGAIEQAERHRISFSDEQLSINTVGYQRFLSIAGWLQVTRGNRNILLPCEKLSEPLRVKPGTISRYRKFAMDDGFLRLMKRHSFKDREATEFRFDVSRVPMLEERAQKGCIEAFRNGAN
ncbi:MAG: hypothetical protein SYC29_02635, partial [Planctomycetota bacterium]|nr:hypothetical protein [Planctomycetota bacterium]